MSSVCLQCSVLPRVAPPDDGEVLGQLAVDRLVEAEERREGEHRDEEEVQPEHHHLQRGATWSLGSCWEVRGNY